MSLDFHADTLCVTTKDGRQISVPIAWFAFLVNATDEKCRNFTICGHSIYWHALEDGIDIDVILLGQA
jgi:hypothetical protein